MRGDIDLAANDVSRAVFFPERRPGSSRAELDLVSRLSGLACDSGVAVIDECLRLTILRQNGSKTRRVSNLTLWLLTLVSAKFIKWALLGISYLFYLGIISNRQSRLARWVNAPTTGLEIIKENIIRCVQADSISIYYHY